MNEDLLTSNYSLIIWIAVFVLAILLMTWFIWRTVSKMKDKEKTLSSLRNKRKEIILDILQGKESLNEPEVAELFETTGEEAHKYLTGLVKERKVVIDKDVGQEIRYKINK